MKIDAGSPRALGRLLTIAAASLTLAGCGNLTGLIDAQDQFGCPMVGGVTCRTVSQTYETERAREVENQKQGTGVHRVDMTGLKPVHSEAATSGVAASALVESRPDRERSNAVRELVHTERAGKVGKIDERIAALRAKPTRISARAPERVLMLWILPWVDDAGDLHDASRVWMRVEDASWRIERVRNRIINGAAPGVEP